MTTRTRAFLLCCLAVVLLASASLTQAQVLSGRCTPSSHHFCVYHDGGVPGKYLVDRGDGSGASPHPTLDLMAGQSYTFQVNGPKFATYPFALSKTAKRASAPLTSGVSGQNPASSDGHSFTFTPSNIGPATLYYQSVLANNLGGKISIRNTCQPSKTRICVYAEGAAEVEGEGAEASSGRDGAVMAVLTGPPGYMTSPEARGTLTLNAGTQYTFEVVGDRFKSMPLALLTSEEERDEKSVVTQGVQGEEPNADDKTLTFTPSPTGPSELFYGSRVVGGVGGRIKIVGACMPSERHICVTQSGGKYAVDTGSGPKVAGGLTLKAGVTYEFEMSGLNDVFQKQPWAITQSRSGGPSTVPYGEGISGDHPGDADDRIVSFTPPSDGPVTLYYQSMNKANMGGTITITNTCKPSRRHICVSVVGGAYAIDQGLEDGPVTSGNIELTAGKAYTFEAKGEEFAKFPMILSLSPDGSALDASAGVSGDKVLKKDDDKLVFTPPASGFVSLYYTSQTRGGPTGGVISLGNVCNPSAHNLCVTHDGRSPGAFLIDNGDGKGPAKGRTLTLKAGDRYVFEVTGKGFDRYPFTLSANQTTSSGPTIPFTLGVSGDNPAALDDQRLIFTPDPLGPSAIHYGALNGRTQGGVIHIQGACEPSEHHICVTHDGGSPGAFLVNTGDGPIRKGSLILNAGERYTFEATDIPDPKTGADAFSRYPLLLTLSAKGGAKAQPIDKNQIKATAGISGSPSSSLSLGILSKDDQRLSYTPASSGFTTLYYQSNKAESMGGKISIANSCNPSETNICVRISSGSPGSYTVDQGRGPTSRGRLVLSRGSEYTFQSVGPAFATRPFALTESPSGRATTPMTESVFGDNPAQADGDRLVFIPDNNTPDRVYYQSLLYSNMGGVIEVSDKPGPQNLGTTRIPGYDDEEDEVMTVIPIRAVSASSDGDDDVEDDAELAEGYEEVSVIAVPSLSSRLARSRSSSRSGDSWSTSVSDPEVFGTGNAGDDVNGTEMAMVGDDDDSNNDTDVDTVFDSGLRPGGRTRTTVDFGEVDLEHDEQAVNKMEEADEFDAEADTRHSVMDHHDEHLTEPVKPQASYASSLFHLRSSVSPLSLLPNSLSLWSLLPVSEGLALTASFVASYLAFTLLAIMQI